MGVKDKDRKWNVNMTHKDNYLQNEKGNNSPKTRITNRWLMLHKDSYQITNLSQVRFLRNVMFTALTSYANLALTRKYLS